ncbi:MAG: hypothetical protein ACM3Q2_08260 [Syntrophothermus sp.]
MKQSKKLLMFIMLFLAATHSLSAQSDFKIFGFFQATLNKMDGGYTALTDFTKMPPMIPNGGKKYISNQSKQDLTSARLQQLNLFVRKDLSEDFTAWVNFEAVNSYNSSRLWGSFSVDEAWINYKHSDIFNVKAGLLIPKFGYFNELKNRFPLIPYINRPLVFENSNPKIDGSEYYPEKAFLQVYGNMSIGEISSLGEVNFNYAAYAGNSGHDYITTANIVGGSGTDTTNFKLFGGRLGLSAGDFRLGVSASSDKANRQSTLKENVGRTRLAVDLGFSIYNIFVEGEYISVKLNSKNSPDNIDKFFYYGTLGYNISDKVFAYGSYSYVRDYEDDILGPGMPGYIFGAGYKPIESLVLKASYSNFSTNATITNTNPLPVGPKTINTDVNLDYKLYQLAVSVLF